MAGHDAGWATSPAVTKPVLTDREREVLGLVAGGLTGGEIAQQLVVSPETIKSHVQNAMTKLGAHTRAHAVAISLRDGQIDPVPRTRRRSRVGTHSERQVGHPPVRARPAAAAAVNSAFGGGRAGR